MEENPNPASGGKATVIGVTTLKRDGFRDIRLEPDAQARADIAKALGITAVRKLRFEGRIEAVGKADWRLKGQLGATVVQPCVVTLEPVTTRIEEPVMRLYLLNPPAIPEGAETEMPEDDSEEPLGDDIDIGAVVLEALALALPPYPRAKDAEAVEMRVTEPGKMPMSNEDARPFSALKGLRDQLKNEGGEE